MEELYELVRLANGVTSLREIANGETFHPVTGPMQEALDLHVAGTQLARRAMAMERSLVVWDVGLGAAANAIAALESVTERIEIHSFDITPAPVRFALRHAAELHYPVGWENALTDLLSHRKWESEDGRQYWQLHLGNFLDVAADRSIPAPDAIFWDLYSPESSPAIWRLPCWERLSARLDPARDCLLTSYSRSSAVRVTMLLAGFFVGHLTGSGEKEEMTVAANRLELIARPLGLPWLERVRRSTNGAPLREGRERLCPIDAEDWRRLERHPQFHRAFP